MTTSILSKKPIRAAISLAFWLIVWQIAALIVGKELLIPTPAAVALRFWDLAATEDFWISAVLSLIRIFSGTLAGGILGIILAAATKRILVCDVIFSPAIRVVRAVPVASFIILILLWVKRGYVPAVISALMVLPVMWESVRAGIEAVDGELLEMSRSYEMSRLSVLRRIYFPAVKPELYAGIRNSIGLAWKSGVAAEVLCLPKNAVGTQIYYSKIYLETPSLFAWTITVIILSVILERVVLRLFRLKQEAESGED